MKSSVKDVFVIGGTICALFFGSGNIVLPLIIGKDAGACSDLAFIGFVIGAVLLPLIGLIAISMNGGDYQKFFSSVGRYALWALPIKKSDANKKLFTKFGNGFSFCITFAVLIVTGPLGVVPRCLTVAEGGFHAIANVPNYIFQLFMVVILWAVVCKKEQVMPMISKVLTPIKLTMIIGVLAVCLLFSPESHSTVHTAVDQPFSWGLVMGYQTLDLIGAIFFGTIIIDYVKSSEHLSSKRGLLWFSVKAGCVGAFILTALYLGFTLLALRFSSVIPVSIKPEDIFVTIASIVMGKYAAVVVGLTIMVSCLTTAVALICVWTTFLSESLKRFNVGYQSVLLISLIVTYFVSLLGLEKILALLSPILVIAYPLILLITLMNLCADVVQMVKGHSK